MIRWKQIFVFQNEMGPRQNQFRRVRFRQLGLPRRSVVMINGKYGLSTAIAGTGFWRRRRIRSSPGFVSGTEPFGFSFDEFFLSFCFCFVLIRIEGGVSIFQCEMIASVTTEGFGAIVVVTVGSNDGSGLFLLIRTKRIIMNPFLPSLFGFRMSRRFPTKSQFVKKSRFLFLLLFRIVRVVGTVFHPIPIGNLTPLPNLLRIRHDNDVQSLLLPRFDFLPRRQDDIVRRIVVLPLVLPRGQPVTSSHRLFGRGVVGRQSEIGDDDAVLPGFENDSVYLYWVDYW
mmetsp:Transcript_18703/g.37960  ORF Transcript_18703/g.37960 Transcript_18703/m.37960 type:complete len:284 (-) Transcript_18703:469-1320(-)